MPYSVSKDIWVLKHLFPATSQNVYLQNLRVAFGEKIRKVTACLEFKRVGVNIFLRLQLLVILRHVLLSWFHLSSEVGIILSYSIVRLGG